MSPHFTRRPCAAGSVLPRTQEFPGAGRSTGGGKGLLMLVAHCAPAAMVYDIETGGGADAVPRRGLHTGAGLGLASDAGSQGQAAVPRRPAGPSRPSRHSYRSPRNAVAPSSAHSDPARAPGVGDLRMQDMQSVLDLRVSKLPRSEPRPGTSHPGGDDNATQHALAPASARPAAPGAAAGVVSRRNAASSSGADGGPATSRQSMEEHLSSLVPGSSFLTEGAVAESLQQSVGFEVVSAAVAESETRRTAVRNGAPLLGTLEALDPMASATRGYQLVARVAAKSGAPSNRLDVNRCLDFDAVRDGSFSSAVDDGAQQEESTLDRIQRVFAREPLPQRLGRRLADARFDSDIGILSRAGSMGGSDMGGARPAQGRPAAAGMEGSTSPRSVPPLALANSSIADAEASSRTQSRRPRPPGRTRSNAVKQTKFGPVLARSLRSRRQTRRIPRPAILGGGAARPYSGDAMREMARQGPATHKREPLTERRGRRSGHDADDEGGAAEDGDGSGPDEADVPTRRRSAADSGGGGSLANPRVAAAGTVLSLSTLAGTGTSRGMNGEAQEPAEASPVRNTRGRTAHDESVSAVQGLFATASAFRSAQVQGVNQLNNTLDAVAYARADKSRRKHIVLDKTFDPERMFLAQAGPHLALMRSGADALASAQRATNRRRATWMNVIHKEALGGAKRAGVEELRLMGALKQVVDDGWSLDSSLFCNIVRLCVKGRDYKNPAVRKLVAVVLRKVFRLDDEEALELVTREGLPMQREFDSDTDDDTGGETDSGSPSPTVAHHRRESATTPRGYRNLYRRRTSTFGGGSVVGVGFELPDSPTNSSTFLTQGVGLGSRSSRRGSLSPPPT